MPSSWHLCAPHFFSMPTVSSRLSFYHRPVRQPHVWLQCSSLLLQSDGFSGLRAQCVNISSHQSSLWCSSFACIQHSSSQTFHLLVLAIAVLPHHHSRPSSMPASCITSALTMHAIHSYIYIYTSMHLEFAHSHDMTRFRFRSSGKSSWNHNGLANLKNRKTRQRPKVFPMPIFVPLLGCKKPIARSYHRP